MRYPLLVLALSLSGCASAQRPAGAPGPFRASEHIGVWESEGYGYVVDSAPDTVRLYHRAGDVCVAQPADESSILDFLDLARADGGGRTLYLSSVLDPFEYTFRRTPSLPAPCLSPPVDTPIGNVDALAAYFGAHYAFFDLYGVDWDARVAAAREAVTDDMDDRALFETMADLLRPLRDSHVKLVAEVDGQELVYDGDPGKTDLAIAAWGERAGMEPDDAVRQFRRGYWFGGIRDTLLAGGGVIAANGRVQYGMLPRDVGYVAFVSMGGFVDGELGTAYQERPALAAVMDDALALFADWGVRAVVVDLSLNTGGYDFVGLDVAGRFAAERTVAFTRRAGDDPGARDVPLYVEPSPGRRFTGTVYVLTSDLTVSAAEVATLSLRALGNVTHVGERTRGAFSTVLTKYLPNGWEVSLSNEVYTDPDGVVWEGRGIEPEVEVPVFDPEDPTDGHVDAVRAVVDLIDGSD